MARNNMPPKELRLNVMHNACQEVYSEGESQELECTKRATNLLDLLRGQGTPILDEAGYDLDLGFIFEISPNFHRTKAFGHVANYAVTKSRDGSDTRVFYMDPFFNICQTLTKRPVRRRLLEQEDPANGIIYLQADPDTNAPSRVAATEHLRPAPFKLEKFFYREVYLGETIGYAVLDHLEMLDRDPGALNKNNLPVLLAD